MILVTGATGSIGSRVARNLRDEGAPVRAFVRDRDKATAMLGDGIELAVGDFGDPGAIRKAVDGVEAVFLSSVDGPAKVAFETGVIDAAAEAGVRRIVKASSIGAEAGSDLSFWDGHGRIEDHLRARGIPAVILNSSFYMTYILFAAEQIRSLGRFFAPAEGAKIAAIHPADVAAVGALALTDGSHEDRSYLLTGPEVITFDEMAKTVSEVLGRDVGFVSVPDDAARQSMAEAGLPDFLVEALIVLMRKLREGVNSTTTDTVRVLLGREPLSFRDFVSEHAAAFQAP